MLYPRLTMSSPYFLPLPSSLIFALVLCVPLFVYCRTPRKRDVLYLPCPVSCLPRVAQD